jgi:glycosyltransferase involved in cell wall biosynthesis
MEFNTIDKLRAGIPVIGTIGWLGGIYYTANLIKALDTLPKPERPQISLIVSEMTLTSIDLYKDILPLADSIVFFGDNAEYAKNILRQPFTQCNSFASLSSYIDFFYPVVGDVFQDLCSGSWIYDFQHVYMPDFFPQSEIQKRNSSFKRIADHAKLVVFSSKNAEADFRKFFPYSRAVSRVLSFHTLPPDEWYSDNSLDVLKKYDLPNDFIICSNQFWIHKNHTSLFEALLILQEAGQKIHLVCTGQTGDDRAPEYFDHIQQLVSNSPLKEFVHILGIIPRIEQIQLMRHALAVIQPSLFEGWSTVVEDACALGKTIILSDLPVHYEQAPRYSEYFDRSNPDDLAQKISRLLPVLNPGPDPSKERQAREESHQLVRDFALQFCCIAVEAQYLYAKR